jgi:hypothetical protein
MMNTPEKGQLCCNLHGVLSFPLPGKPIPAMIQYHDSSAYYSEKQYRSFCITFLQTTSAYRGVCDLRKFCKEQFIQLKNIKSKKETWS